jgi:hypothetical protein
VFFLKDKPAFRSTRDNDAGCAVTSFSAFNFAASSGIVISGSASIHSSRADRCGASLPPPGGRPCRAGRAEPVRDTRSASLTAKLALTSYRPRCRPTRLTAIDLRLNPFPKINRIRLPHPGWPPSLPASILNQISDSLGIPFRFLFHARRSSAGHQSYGRAIPPPWIEIGRRGGSIRRLVAAGWRLDFSPRLQCLFSKRI